MAIDRVSAAIGSLGVGMLLAAASLAWLLGAVDTTVQVCLAVGTVLVIGALYRDRQSVQELTSTRAFLYGSGSSAVVALVGMLGVMGYLVATKYDKSIDLTSDSRHSLAQQTKAILADLSEPVQVIAFYENDSAEQAAFRTMIRRFQDVSPQLEVEFVDPLRQPLMANNYNITSEYGAVVLEAGDKKRELAGIPLEKELARALMLLFSNKDHRVCWSLGHGEPSPDDAQSEDGLGGIVTQLESLNYTITKSHILTQGIDPECEILVIARPMIDWMDFELAALAAYLAGGGQVFAALEPGMAASLTNALKRYGIALADDVIVDVNPKTG